MGTTIITAFALDTVSGLFALAGLFNLFGGRLHRTVYRNWDYPAGFYRAVGLFEVVAALLLALPHTRIWGVILAGLITFFSIVALLNRREYLWSLLVMAVLAALIPASLA